MRRSLLPLLISSIALFGFRSEVPAQWKSIGAIGKIERLNDGILLSSDQARIQISVVSAKILRIRMSKDGAFAPDSSWAIVRKTLGDTRYELKESESGCELSTSNIHVRIQKSPCRISFYDLNDSLINADDPAKGMSWAGNEIAVWKTMPQDEAYFGFGEKAGKLERRGTAMSNWNSDIPAYNADTDPLYETLPFFYGIRNGRTYGIFFDNTYRSFFSMGKEHPDQYSFGAADGEMNYYFIYGPTPREVLAQFSGLIGTMPLPPLWSIGYQQCRWSYYPESRVREIASNFRTKQIPCDVIYLDIHYMDGYRCFTWDTTRFPNPKKMVGDLAKDGFNMVTIIDPGIKVDSTYPVFRQGLKGNHFAKYPDGTLFTGTVWPGKCAFPDFTRKETRAWWGTLYRGLVDVGIKGFWNDMNEPSVFDSPNRTFDLNVMHDDRGLHTDHRKNHNVYGMQMARGSYEGAMSLRPNERPFILTRASYAGGNCYSAAWTGDNISSWEHLRLAIPMCLNLSISGQPFVGTDIGGFIGAPSGELYARWLQLGVFTPLMRSHSDISAPNKEPWEYGTRFEDINRSTIELRYKLLPYIYTEFYNASRTGIPMMRPLFFDFPNDHDTYWSEREFLFGDALLIAPVITEGETKRSFRLPEGDWYNFWTDEKYTGPNWITVDAPIERIPIFVKAGGIVPMREVVQYTGQHPIDSLAIHIYPSAEDSTQLYEDDGHSLDYQKGKFCKRWIVSRSTANRHEVLLSQPEGSYRPPDRLLLLTLHAVAAEPKSVTLDRRELHNRSTSDVGTNEAGWRYDSAARTLVISAKDNFKKQSILISY